MIVIDVGCAPHGAEVSIEPLVERFAPDVLYGFDPFLEHPSRYAINGTTVELEPKAAWTHTGYLGFVDEGLRSRVYEPKAGTDEHFGVPCFDLAAFVASLVSPFEQPAIESVEKELGRDREVPGKPANEPVVLKLDCEGAERRLLRHLCWARADELLSLLLVEWHCESCGRGGDNVEECPNCGAPVEKIGGLRCPVEEWS